MVDLVISATAFEALKKAHASRNNRSRSVVTISEFIIELLEE